MNETINQTLLNASITPETVSQANKGIDKIILEGIAIFLNGLLNLLKINFQLNSVHIGVILVIISLILLYYKIKNFIEFLRTALIIVFALIILLLALKSFGVI